LDAVWSFDLITGVSVSGNAGNYSIWQERKISVIDRLVLPRKGTESSGRAGKRIRRSNVVQACVTAARSIRNPATMMAAIRITLEKYFLRVVMEFLPILFNAFFPNGYVVLESGR